MTLRPLISFVIVIAMQALAGCGMPAKGGVTASDDRSHARKAEREARDAQLRKRVEAGTLGLAQLFPGGTMVDARSLPPLPRPSAVVPLAVVSVPAPRASAAATPSMQLASSAAAVQPDGCAYKAVMSDADIEACR